MRAHRGPERLGSLGRGAARNRFGAALFRPHLSPPLAARLQALSRALSARPVQQRLFRRRH